MQHELVDTLLLFDCLLVYTEPCSTVKCLLACLQRTVQHSQMSVCLFTQNRAAQSNVSTKGLLTSTHASVHAEAYGQAIPVASRSTAVIMFMVTFMVIIITRFVVPSLIQQPETVRTLSSLIEQPKTN